MRNVEECEIERTEKLMSMTMWNFEIKSVLLIVTCTICKANRVQNLHRMYIVMQKLPK